MSGVKQYFSDLNEILRDSHKLCCTRKGQHKAGMEPRILLEVLYVIELTNNLLSIGQLQERGLAVMFQYGRCKAFHHEKGLIIDTNMSGNRMFILQATFQPLPSVCFNSITEDKVQL